MPRMSARTASRAGRCARGPGRAPGAAGRVAVDGREEPAELDGALHRDPDDPGPRPSRDSVPRATDDAQGLGGAFFFRQASEQ